jgi:predicted nucleotide-binding protein (sugar kinase/HSP70/actin superfamily)
MIDFFRRDDPIRIEKIERGFEPNPWLSSLIGVVSKSVYQRAWKLIRPISQRFRYYEEHADCYGLMDRISHIFDKSFKVGEGWLIAAEILDMADHGIESFVIVQPFGCIPNHISGRGVLKSIQNEVPQVQIVALDFDPDTPFANFENRLQMLIWNAKKRARESDTALEQS